MTELIPIKGKELKFKNSRTGQIGELKDLICKKGDILIQQKELQSIKKVGAEIQADKFYSLRIGC